MPNPPSKAALRHAALDRRDALSPEVRADAAHVLADYAERLPIPAGSVVSGFWPIRSEIDPRPLMHGLAERRNRLCLPVVIDRIRIAFRSWTPGADLVETGFGTRGPGPEAPVVDPDVMLMPMAVFDRRGGRIGYGAGHYDRAIELLHRAGRRPVLIGLAFACQETEAVPLEPHDQMLHVIATETDIIACQGEKDI